MEAAKQFDYNGQQIAFELAQGNVMVNATHMAKIFDKQVIAFLRNDETKNFISECLKSENCHFLSIEKEDDLITSKQKSGTFMHRVLALKFAAWLSPAFELWVYKTIDELLFGQYRAMEASIKASAERRNQLEEVKKRLLEHEDFHLYQRLQLEEKQSAYSRTKTVNNQLNLFRGL